MANDVNSVVLVGRLAKDAELRYTANGIAVCRLTLAVNRYGGKEGGRQTSYIDVSVWSSLAERLHDYLLKGRQICVQGELRQNRWEQDGQNRSRVEVVAQHLQMLGNRFGDQPYSNDKMSKTEGDPRYEEFYMDASTLNGNFNPSIGDAGGLVESVRVCRDGRRAGYGRPHDESGPSPDRFSEDVPF